MSAIVYASSLVTNTQPEQVKTNDMQANAYYVKDRVQFNYHLYSCG